LKKYQKILYNFASFCYNDFRKAVIKQKY